MAVRQFTMDDLKRLLVAAADVPPSMVVDDPAATLLDLNVDSAGLLGLQLELEAGYGVIVGEADLPHLLTVGSAVEHVNRLLAATASPAAATTRAD